MLRRAWDALGDVWCALLDALDALIFGRSDPE